MTDHRFTRGAVVLLLAGAAGLTAASTAQAASATLYSSLSFSGSPGDAISGGPASGTFATPKAHVSATGTSAGYTVTVTSGKNIVVFTLAPPKGHFTLGSTFTASGDGAGAQGQFQITADGRMCASQTSSVTVKDVGYDATGAVTRIALSFLDHCGTPTTPPAVGNLYIDEPEVAPVPTTTVYATPLMADPSTGPVSGTAAGYNIAPARSDQYIVTTNATGLTAGDQYEGVVAFDLHGRVTQDVDVCALTVTDTGGGSCIGAVTVPVGTVAYGDQFLIEQVASGQSRVTVATGTFLASKP